MSTQNLLMLSLLVADVDIEEKVDVMLAKADLLATG